MSDNKSIADEWISLSNEPGNLKFRKEALPLGDYTKKQDDLEFTFDERFANLVVTETDRYHNNGNTSSLVHTHKGEESFGKVLALSIAPSKEVEGDALFLDIEFADEESKKFGLKHDISVYIPPSFVDGKGREYKRPLRHVALTTDPVIPGLGKWEPLAASFETLRSKNMSSLKIADVAKLLDIEGDEDLDKKVTDAITELKAQKSEPGEDPDGQSSAPGADDGEGGETGGESGGKAIAASFSPAIISTVAGARETQISSLVESFKIDPATGDELRKRYCGKKELALSLANEDSDDGFDNMIAILKKNDPKNPQTDPDDIPITLSHEQNDGNPLVENAKKRAEAAKS